MKPFSAEYPIVRWFGGETTLKTATVLPPQCQARSSRLIFGIYILTTIDKESICFLYTSGPVILRLSKCRT